MKLTIVTNIEGTRHVAVCLEHFIAAQGATEEEAIFNLFDTIYYQIQLDKEGGKQPLESILPAPKSYHEW